MTNDEKYEYWIAAVLRSISDLQYERKNLQQRMEENRKQMAECKDILNRLEEERRAEHERERQNHANAEPAPVVG